MVRVNQPYWRRCSGDSSQTIGNIFIIKIPIHSFSSAKLAKTRQYDAILWNGFWLHRESKLFYGVYYEETQVSQQPEARKLFETSELHGDSASCQNGNFMTLSGGTTTGRNLQSACSIHGCLRTRGGTLSLPWWTDIQASMCFHQYHVLSLGQEKLTKRLILAYLRLYRFVP